MDTPSVVERKRKCLVERVKPIPGIGMVMAMVAGVLLATGSLTVKLVESLSGIEIVVARSLFMSSMLLVFIICQKDSLMPPVGERFPLIMRSLIGCVSIILSYSSIKLIPLGDSQSIVFSSPIFVSILGFVILKEPCEPVHIMAVFAAIVGIFLISRPSFIFPRDGIPLNTSSDRTLGLIMALCSCLGASLCFICMRRLPKTSASVVVFWYSILCVIAGLVVSFYNGTFSLPKELTDYVYLLLCGLTGLSGQGMITLALKIENAGPVSLARTTEIMMAFIYQITILDETLSVYSATGATILGTGVIIVALHKWYSSDPEKFKNIFRIKTKTETKSSDTKQSYP